MTGILNFIIDAVAPEGIVGTDFPWSKWPSLTAANPFTMPTFGASFGGKQIIVATALEDVRSFCDSRR